MKYLVMEIQTSSDGTVGNLVFSFDTENAAWSKYHDILHYAAVSDLPMHACVMITNDGNLIDQKCFRH